MKPHRHRRGPGPLRALVSLLLLIAVAGCDRKPAAPASRESPAAAPIVCDPDNGGLTLPKGFCALVVADHFANLRDIAVNANGDIYGTLLNRRMGFGGLVALRDNNGDGRADQIESFAEEGGVGIAIHNHYLYIGGDRAIRRYRLDGELVPRSPPEVVVSGFPDTGALVSKAFAFDGQGGLYVSVGASSNACQKQDRSPGSPGLDPCPQLESSAGIWRFDADRINQDQIADGAHYASGIRHALAVDVQPASGEIYVVQHGRDQLNELWPDKFSAEQGEVLPAEEMLHVTPRAVFSWPYCYYDPFQHRRVLAPEYGGDGMRVDRCAPYPDPVIAFPAHYGPNDLQFYRGRQFPLHYRGGAFIAFHGAYRQMSAARAGYQVVFVPFEKGVASGQWEVFADGFAGGNGAVGPEEAEHRPTGLAEGQDGSLYIADSVTGRIWRVIYRVAAPAKDSAGTLPQSPGSKAE